MQQKCQAYCPHNMFDEYGNIKKRNQLTQTYSLAQGFKKFVEKGTDAAFGEMKQIHDQRVLQPIRVNGMTPLDHNQYRMVLKG